MENVNVETTQNVNIEYPIAGIPDRIAATMLDLLIMAGYLLIIGIIIGSVSSTTYENPNRELTYTLWAIFSLPILCYSLIFETFMNGQSIGKRALRIKVMRLDGRQPSFGNYLMRWIMRVIDIQIFSGIVAIVTIFINGKGQRLGDMAAGTFVIKTNTGEEISKTPLINIQEEYVPLYPEVSQLTEKDISIIKRVLLLKEDENSEETIEKLVKKLSAYLSIQPTLDGREFLMALLKDYKKVHGRG